MPRGDAHLDGLGLGPAVLRNGVISPERQRLSPPEPSEVPWKEAQGSFQPDKLTRRNRRLQDSVEQEARRSAGLGGVRV